MLGRPPSRGSLYSGTSEEPPVHIEPLSASLACNASRTLLARRLFAEAASAAVAARVWIASCSIARSGVTLASPVPSTSIVRAPGLGAAPWAAQGVLNKGVASSASATNRVSLARSIYQPPRGESRFVKEPLHDSITRLNKAPCLASSGSRFAVRRSFVQE